MMNFEKLPDEIQEMVMVRLDDATRFGKFASASHRSFALAYTSALPSLNFVTNVEFNSLLRKCMTYLANYSEENVVSEREICAVFAKLMRDSISTSPRLSLLPLTLTKSVILPGSLPAGVMQTLVKLTPNTVALFTPLVIDTFYHITNEMSWFDEEIELNINSLSNLRDLSVLALKCRINSVALSRLYRLQLYYDFHSAPNDEFAAPSPCFQNLVANISSAVDLHHLDINFAVPLQKLKKLINLSLVLTHVGDVDYFADYLNPSLKRLAITLEMMGAAFPDLNLLPNLEILELKKVYYIKPENIIGLTNLRKIKLTSDSQLVLPAFPVMPLLESFTLIGTKTRRLSDEETNIILNQFGTLKKLKLINLSLNEDILPRIPRCFLALTHLKLHLILFRASKLHSVETMLKNMDRKRTESISLKGLPLSPSFVAQLPLIFRNAKRVDILTNDQPTSSMVH